MFVYPKFDVDLIRRVDKDNLGWPAPDEADDDTGLGCNLMYTDLRRFSWADAKRVCDLEQELITRVESAVVDADLPLEALEEEVAESERYLHGLDLGVASTVVALSAAKCIPFSSCNAGVFGGQHQEKYPLIAFYARAQMVDLLLTSAEESEIGLRGDEYVIAYSDDIRKFGRFFRSLVSRRSQFSALRARERKRKIQVKSEQYRFLFE